VPLGEGGGGRGSMRPKSLWSGSSCIHGRRCKKVGVCVCVCMYVCMYVYQESRSTHTCVCARVCVCLCVYVYNPF
jgi:hypothetical protein